MSVTCSAGGRIDFVAVIIAVSVNTDGRREVLGIEVAHPMPFSRPQGWGVQMGVT
ncbi:transposase [Rhizobium sp. IBUN]|uniref:transposase n=1 Tax=Rhizobium sp. IBUN TaxID=1042326 RepID=UPI000404DF54|nr:transposase [Rhizobium sp. IBUN]